MKSLTIIFLIGISPIIPSAYAHGPHVHGVGELDIAFENSKEMTIAFESPSVSLYGFETEAKTPEQKSEQAKKLDIFKTKVGEILILDQKLGCHWKTNKVEVVKEKEDDDDDDHDEADEHHDLHAEHRSVETEWNVKCENELFGQTLKIDFQTQFPHLQKLKVNLLKDNSQSSKELKNGKGEMKL